MSFDFSNAQLPRLLPLEASYAENDVEADLKRLFIDLFDSALAVTTFDVNVLGAAHLGSLDLVRKSINTDGLVLLPGEREEAATRFLYRAWKSGNMQGRGLHFLRTYLQILFPNIGTAVQLWQKKGEPYPTALHDFGHEDSFLTSRIRVSINDFPQIEFHRLISSCIVNVVPARFILNIRYVATSSIGKIRPVCVGSMAQAIRSSGLLLAAPRLETEKHITTAGTVHGAQSFRSKGIVS